jgi:hypothetical protein
MDLPEQPPPDAPAPPPGPEAIRSRWIMRRIVILGGLSVLGIVMILMALQPTRAPHYRSMTDASNNARQIHLGLYNFDDDFGTFPNASTIVDVQAATSTSIPLGTSSSNEMFRQLLAANVVSGESIFWARSATSPRRPDDNITGSLALEKGECVFAYVAGLSSSSPSDTPVLLAPVNPAKRGFTRSKEYNNKAVVLFVSGSVKYLPVDKHGKVEINGMDLFDPRQPFWGGKAPDIKWPE